ncbi:MAG TPA: MraY family glycosyltransferase, partial [Longimicrobiaceae bacterium]
WVVAVTNAFNLIDGLDGLATGIAIVALGTTLWVAVALKQHDGALAAAALLGALLGFLRYNFNPARIFLGDSGSLFVGFLLAVLSVASSTKSSTAVLAAVPLLALGLPLTDVALAMLRRWLRGVSFASADRRHIHHQLLALGLSQRRAALVMYVVSTALAGVAVTIVFSPPRLVLAITTAGAALCVAFLALGLRRLAYHELAVAGSMLKAPLRLRRIIQDRINAHDLAEVLRMAESLQAVNAILEDNVPNFEFAHMEVCFERELGRRRPPRSGPNERLWWMVSPLLYPQRGTDHLALAIWCPAEGARRPHGAERIAQILGPVLSEWASRNVHVLPVAAARYPEPQFEVPPFGVQVDRAAAAPA